MASGPLCEVEQVRSAWNLQTSVSKMHAECAWNINTQNLQEIFAWIATSTVASLYMWELMFVFIQKESHRHRYKFSLANWCAKCPLRNLQNFGAFCIVEISKTFGAILANVKMLFVIERFTVWQVIIYIQVWLRSRHRNERRVRGTQPADYRQASQRLRWCCQEKCRPPGQAASRELHGTEGEVERCCQFIATVTYTSRICMYINACHSPLGNVIIVSAYRDVLWRKSAIRR